MWQKSRKRILFNISNITLLKNVKKNNMVISPLFETMYIQGDPK